ncbi:MAG: DUF3572 domain-containing protein [Rhizobiaceae bacterium]
MHNRQTPDAEAIAVAALGFIAGDPDLLGRFLALSGIDVGSIRAAAREPGFLAGVLAFIAAHEPTLVAFCAASAIEAPEVMRAMRALPGGEAAWEGST